MIYESLSIASPGDATLPRVEKRTFQMKDPNDVSDIDGAQSAPRYKLFTNKPQFLTSDVEGAAPKPLIRSRNVRDNTLYIDDIEGTRHTIKDRMMRTRRSVNPLDPEYVLPSFALIESAPNKFIKDPLNINDIEGSKSRAKREYSTRDVLGVDDIDGARPGLKHRIQTRDILNSEDVSTKKNRITDKTTRVTDPNNPIYRINGMEIVDDKFTKPKQPKKFIADNFLLRTDDIQGAIADTRQADHFPRKEIKNTNFISDIPGARADSIKHSVITSRATNPLQPVYQSLDPGEVLLPLIPPLIPPSLIRIPTLPPVKREVTSGTQPIFGLSNTLNETGANFSNKSAPQSRQNSARGKMNESVHPAPGVGTGYLLPLAPSQKKSKASELEAEINLVRNLP